MQWCALHAVWLKDPAGLRVHLGLAYECRKTFARRRNAHAERHSLQRPCSLVAATARQGDRGFFESFPSLSNDASPKSDTFAPCAKTPAGLKRHWGSCVTEERPMQAQAEYRRTVDDAVQRATRILVKHQLQPQNYRIHIQSKGTSSPAEPHSLSISTADGAFWVTEASLPFRCIEEVDPFESDAFCSIVSNQMMALIRKVRQAGRSI